MRQEHTALRNDMRLARVISGLVLGVLFAAAMIFTNAIAASPAAAQDATSLWAERDSVVEQLAKGYGEEPRALGVTADGAVLELFTAEDGETWTITVTLPNGLSRVIATGKHWIVRPLLAKGQVS